jgi:hypothetical protein
VFVPLRLYLYPSTLSLSPSFPPSAPPFLLITRWRSRPLLSPLRWCSCCGSTIVHVSLSLSGSTISPPFR